MCRWAWAPVDAVGTGANSRRCILKPDGNEALGALRLLDDGSITAETLGLIEHLVGSGMPGILVIARTNPGDADRKAESSERFAGGLIDDPSLSDGGSDRIGKLLDLRQGREFAEDGKLVST